MTTGKRIHCWIVAVPASEEPPVRTLDRPARTADPFIDGLIAKLQAEVRAERRRASGPSWPRGRRFETASRMERAEAEITWHDWPLDFTEPDFDAWERGTVLPGRPRNLPR